MTRVIKENNIVIGFTLMEYKSYQFKDFTNSELMSFIFQGNAIDNLKMDGLSITSSNGSIDRYPTIHLVKGSMQLDDSNKAVIIGKYSDNYFQMVNGDNKCITAKAENVVMAAASGGIKLSNASVVSNEYIRSISGEFKELGYYEKKPTVVSIKAEEIKKAPSQEVNKVVDIEEVADLAQRDLQRRQDTTKVKAEVGQVGSAKTFIKMITVRKEDLGNKNEIDSKYGISLEEKIAIAATTLRSVDVFLYAAFLKLNRVYLKNNNSKKVNTFGVSIDTLYINVEYALKLTLDETAYALYHEISHILMGHSTRRNGRNPKAWNISADLFINRHIAEVTGCTPHNPNTRLIYKNQHPIGFRFILNKNEDGSLALDKDGKPKYGLCYDESINTSKTCVELIYSKLIEENRDKLNKQKEKSKENNEDKKDDSDNTGEDDSDETGENDSDDSSTDKDSTEEDSNQNEDGEQDDSSNSDDSESSDKSSDEDTSEQNGDDSESKQDNSNDEESDKESSEDGENSNSEEESGSQGMQGSSEDDLDESSENGSGDDSNGSESCGIGDDEEDEEGSSEQGNGSGSQYGDEESDQYDDSYEDGSYGDGSYGDGDNGDGDNSFEEDGESDEEDGLDDINYNGEKVGDFRDQDSDLLEEEGLSEDEAKRKAQSFLKKVQETARQLGSTGSSPFNRIIEEAMQEDKVWKSFIKRFFNGCNKVEKSYKRPSRKGQQSQFILKGNYRNDADSITRVFICIDTSGSMSDKDLAKALGYILNLMQVANVEGMIIFWDTEIAGIHEFKDVRSAIEAFKGCKGGGGTNPDCVIKYIDTLKVPEKPKLLVFITDGYIGEMKYKFNKRFGETIWIINDYDSYLTFKAPFGKVAPLKPLR